MITNISFLQLITRDLSSKSHNFVFIAVFNKQITLKLLHSFIINQKTQNLPFLMLLFFWHLIRRKLPKCNFIKHRIQRGINECVPLCIDTIKKPLLLTFCFLKVCCKESSNESFLLGLLTSTAIAFDNPFLCSNSSSIVGRFLLLM